jgi:flagellar P-ring protein FlgI
MIRFVTCVILFLLAYPGGDLDAQGVRVRDLTRGGGDVPVRLVGYGLVTGLDGTGDRIYGGGQRSMTVRAIANLMRNMGIEVPEEVIRSRNVAAVLVTAEASPFTRQGGRFDVSVASLGDATSLRGGQLWPTPLTAGVGAPVAAVAQGNILVGTRERPSRYDVETSATIADAGVARLDFGGSAQVSTEMLILRDPDIATAHEIAEEINAVLGSDIATVVDPGAVALELPEDSPFAALVAIGNMEVTPSLRPRVVIRATDGVVAVGGDIRIGSAVVSHDWITLTIGSEETVITAAAGTPPEEPALVATPAAPGNVRLAAGVRVQNLTEALHAVGASGEAIGSIFRSLRDVGALQAEVQIR